MNFMKLIRYVLICKKLSYNMYISIRVIKFYYSPRTIKYYRQKSSWNTLVFQNNTWEEEILTLNIFQVIELYV